MYPSSPKPSQELRQTFKTPEGTYRQELELRLGSLYSIMGSDRLGPKMTLARLKGRDEEGVYLLINVGETLHIYAYDGTERVSWGGPTMSSFCSGGSFVRSCVCQVQWWRGQGQRCA